MFMVRFAGKLTCGCLLLVVVGATLIALALGLFLARTVEAAPHRLAQSTAATPAPLFDIVLVSDQSVSMWDCDGVGSDPELLRVDAAHLFINYLGADSSNGSNGRFRLGLIHFGGDVQVMAPLTSVSTAAARSELAAVAADPQPIPWTDPLQALEAAREMLTTTGQPASRRVIVLLTDGEPAWPDDAAANPGLYKAALRGLAQELALEQTALYVVQLTNPNTTCNQRMISEWMSVWEEIVATAGGGAIQTAAQAADLLPIYHTIVRDLIVRDTGNLAQSQPLLEAQPLVERQPYTVTVTVDTALTSMTLVILKQDADTHAAIQGPHGADAQASAAGVTVAGDGGKQEVWRFLAPAQGVWQVVLLGRGEVTVWQDRVLPLPTATPLPLPTHTPLPPTPTPTMTATPTATPTATSTATPTATSTATPTPSPLPPTATATLTATATSTPVPPAPSATPLPPAPAVRGQTPGWLFGGGALLAGGIGLGVVLAVRRRGTPLRGELTPVRTPAAARTGGELLSLDLGSRRRRRVALGVRGKGQWRLPGWNGSAYLESVANGQTRLSPEGAGSGIALNGTPLLRPAILHDGDLLSFGEYRLRYDNLLQ